MGLTRQKHFVLETKGQHQHQGHVPGWDLTDCCCRSPPPPPSSTRMYPNILRLSMFMGLLEGQWTLLVSSCLRSTNRVNLGAREHADSQNIWIHPRTAQTQTVVIALSACRALNDGKKLFSIEIEPFLKGLLRTALAHERKYLVSCHLHHFVFELVFRRHFCGR